MSRVSVACVCALFLPMLAMASCSFDDIEKMHGRNYATASARTQALAAFKTNSLLVESVNAQNLPYTLSNCGPFADMSVEHFRNFLGNTSDAEVADPSFSDPVTLPSSVDWRLQGAICPVCDEGPMGEPDFMSNASIAAACKISGATAGLVCNQPCAQCKMMKNITPNNETRIAQVLSQRPVLVYVEADTSIFQLYRSGVIDSTACGTQVNHQLMLVGYTSTDTENYWSAQNSWGRNWGENGYLRLAKDTGSAEGECGLAIQPKAPVCV